jgi:RTX calcium-binding nonapeptide repeat (4 copies)
MRLPMTFQKLRNRLTTKRQSRGLKKKSRRPLSFEQLEDRVTPTILWSPFYGAETAGDGGGEKLGVNGPVPVYLIFWGSYWNTSAGSLLADNTQFVVNEILSQSALLDGLHEYGINYRAYIPTSRGAAFDYTDPSGTTLSDSQVQNEVQYAIDHLGLPEPDDTSSEPIYLVISAPGIGVPGANGYHSVYTNYDPFFPIDGDETVYGWIGNINGSLDHLTKVISHEVIEAMTDPQPGNGITVSVPPAAESVFQGDNEICDNEAAAYSYRLFGSAIQSFWSQANGAYEVSDGTSQNFWVRPFWNSSNQLVEQTLDLYGDQLGANSNDTFNIFTDSSGGVLVEMNNEIADFDKGAITSIVIFPGGGHNTINIYSTKVPVYVASTSYDTVNVGLGYTVNIKASVNVFNYGGGGAYDTLNVDDSNDMTGRGGIVHSDEIDYLAPAPIYYHESNVNLYGGRSSNDWIVFSTSAYSTYIQTGSGGTSTTLDNFIYIESTNGPLTVDGGSSNQLVIVGYQYNQGNGGTLAGINSFIVVENSNSDGKSDLKVYDNSDPSGQTFNLYFDEITSTAMPGYINWITFGPGSGGLTDLEVYDGTGFNTFNVFSTGLDPWSYQTLLYTGTGGADVNVQSTLGPLFISNGGGQNSVMIGSQAPTDTGGTVANINGYVGVAGSGSTSLYIDDSGDTAAKTVSMIDYGSFGFIRGLAPATISYSGVNYLNVHGGSGGNTFSLDDTFGPAPTTFIGTGTGNDTVNVLATSASLTIDGQNGTDTVTIGSQAPSLGGTLASIAGPVNVSNSSGGTTLRVDDSGDTVSQTATLTDGLLTGLAPAAISWTPTATTSGGVDFLDILGGSGGNTFNVLNTSYLDFGTRIQTGTGNDMVNVQATTGVFSVYNNAGSDTVTIGSLAPSLGGTLASISAYVVAGGPGPVAVIVDDSGDATGRAATLTRSAVSTNTLSGMSPAPIYYENNVTSLTIDAGSGNDSLTLAGPATNTQVIYNGGGGTNTLVGPDVASTFTISSFNGGTVGNVTFSSVQNLIGGAGNDTFVFRTGGSLAGSINGGAGTNRLDYSAYVGDIVVNMPLNKATAVGGSISGIQSVLGSIGNDLIVGDANANVLQGGTGRNIIIGGAGPDQITGGAGDNILIGGTTLWDTNATALQAIMQAWLSNTGFDQRVNALRRGIVVNGVTYALNTSTVHADSSPDRLIGGSGQNWFFVDFDDVIDNGAGPAPTDRVTRV